MTKPATRSPLSIHFHDLNNTVGAIALNLEVASDPAQCSGGALESVLDAIEEIKKLKRQLVELRALVDPKP
jgi:hypothetical protein